MKRGPAISTKRKLIYCLAMITLMIVAVEVVSFSYLKFTVPDYSLYDSIQIRGRIIVNEDSELLDRPSMVVLHPYLGFVYTPESNERKTTADHGGLTVTQYGFLDDGPPFHKVQNDSVVIGVFGGSVASQFSVHGTESLLSNWRPRSFPATRKSRSFAWRWEDINNPNN